MNYIYDTHDRHIMGYNENVLNTFPTRFRLATQEEVDEHFGLLDEVTLARKETEEREKLREDMEHGNFSEEDRQAKIRQKRIDALALARRNKQLKREQNESGRNQDAASPSVA